MILTELPFLPSLFYCAVVSRFSLLYIEAKENYNKGSFRNKTMIKSNQGTRYLNVPLQQGKHQGTPIQETLISRDEDWKRNLEKTLQTEYGKYPYYDIYFEELKPLLITSSPHYFFPMSLRIFHWIFCSLELDMPVLTIEYESEPGTGIVDFRNRITPAFIQRNSDLLEQQKLDYFQFTPGHSVVEALFSYGPEVIWLVRKYAAQSDFLSGSEFQDFQACNNF